MNYFDRVRDTTTTTGTGTITVSGTAATPGYQAFATAFSVGETFPYGITGQTGTEFEVGIGTLVTATTISRDTVFRSSNSNALVNFSAGTKDVFVPFPAAQINTIARGYAAARGYDWA